MTVMSAKEKYSFCYNRFTTKNDIWNLEFKKTVTDFSKIESEYNFNIHFSVKEYFNSYWHDYIIGHCMTNEGTIYDGIVLLPVNSDDLLNPEIEFGFVNLLEDWLREHNFAVDYTPIGWSGYYGAEILVDNLTGKIKVCWNEYDDLLEFEAENLADLISKMADSLEYNEAFRLKK
jgi:hypothetical protein